MDVEENITLDKKDKKNNNETIESNDDSFTFNPNKNMIKRNYPSFNNNKYKNESNLYSNIIKIINLIKNMNEADKTLEKVEKEENVKKEIFYKEGQAFHKEFMKKR